MSWRPKDWDFRRIALERLNIVVPLEPCSAAERRNELIDIYHSAIEAGADAMLTAIRKEIDTEDVKVYGDQCGLCLEFLEERKD